MQVQTKERSLRKILGGSEKSRFLLFPNADGSVYLLDAPLLAPPTFWVFFGRRTAWMLGNTPP